MGHLRLVRNQLYNNGLLSVKERGHTRDGKVAGFWWWRGIKETVHEQIRLRNDAKLIVRETPSDQILNRRRHAIMGKQKRKIKVRKHCYVGGKNELLSTMRS